MKSHLSHILPVWKACDILGYETVYRTVHSFIRLKESISMNSSGNSGVNSMNRPVPTTTSDEDIKVLCKALCYQPPDNDVGDAVPDSIINAWKKWVTHPLLVIENKSMFIQFVVPSTVHPHPGPTGHMGLFDCWVYALQGHAAQNINPANTISNSSYYTTSSMSGNSNPQPPTIWLPDIIILFAISKDYHDFRLRQKRKIVEYRRRKHKEQQEKPLQQEATSRNLENDCNDSEKDKNFRRINDTDDDELILSPYDRKIIWKMATLSYRIYDSYQKKGILQLDTIHRFLTDVYGEESYKQPKTKSLLDLIFYLPSGNDLRNNIAQHTPSNQHNNYSQNLQATVSEQQFCKRVLDTVRIDDVYSTHILLDWISLLACSMIPLEAIPASISSYLDTLQLHDVAKSQASICQLFNLAENRLYEIKRKFHSMVAKSNSSAYSVIRGHPMTSATDANDDNGNGGTISTPGTAIPLETEYQSNTLGSSSHKVISAMYFIQSLSSPNEELGTGGYLPPMLALLVFHAGSTQNGTSNHTLLYNSHATSSHHNAIFDQSDGTSGWGLHNVLQFGCVAVRHNNSTPQDPDVALLRFLFSMFQLASPHIDSDVNPSITDKKVLTRSQVVTMIELLVDYAVYRRLGDSPPMELDDTQSDENKEDDEDQWLYQQRQSMVSFQSGSFDLESYEKNTMKDLAACILLGLIPPTYKLDDTYTNSRRNRKTVSLKLLVDYALDGNTLIKDQMTFDEFVTWHSTKMTETGPRTRLGPLMIELRLIAAVQFGIPPVLASMEITLIAEIERRHKLRYPQTDVSRRGPRGTIWYIIDSLWFTSWANLVKKTAGTPLDSNDGRGGISNPDRSRTMNRIRNASLLVENGSLALRSDIRWKHDYEILPPLAWSALQAWYDGGPPIYRSVVKYIPISSSSSPHSNQASNTIRGQYPTEYEIELYPLFVTVYLCDSASRGEAKPFQQQLQLSRVSPVMVMLVQLCKELDVNPDQARLWLVGNKNRYDPSDPNASTLLASTTSSEDSGKFGITDDWILGLDQNIIEQLRRRGSNVTKDTSIVLLLEIKDRDTGLWPRGVDGTEWAYIREKNAALSTSTHIVGNSPSDLGDGIVGLYNMGNTCYLNSSVQCLSHTPIFREYFTSKAYLNDINTTNPLGYEGRLAQVTAMLINSLWKRFSNQVHDPSSHQKRVTAPGSYAQVTAPALTPKTFKESLSKFNEHFQGNEQHDAQELLAFLLGGLSEDLNRIVNKPYIEAPDSDGRPDKELADIWWSNHLKREMSIIVALFTGQYKSLLTCRTCKYESARFEPFSFLQVPLPEDDNLTVSLILYPIKENSCAVKYCVRVRNDGKLRDVLIALAKVLHQDEMDEIANQIVFEEKTSKEHPFGNNGDIPIGEDCSHIDRIQNLAVVDMRDGYISKIAPNSWSLQDLQNRETGELPLLHVFELDPIRKHDRSKGNDFSSLRPTEKVEDVTVDEVDTCEENKKLEPAKPRQAYLAIAQRRSELMSINYLHPLVHRVFGTPILLRVDDLENCTGHDLYDIVAKRLKNVVHRSVHRFLSPKDSKKTENNELSGGSQASSNLATIVSDGESRVFRDVAASVYRTLTDAEEVSAGPVPRYGFRLRITSRDGRRCLSCPWYESCIGCLVPDDDKPTVVMDGDSAVVDWHFAVDVASNGFGLRSNSTDIGQTNSRLPRNTATVTVKNHSSCGTGVNAQNMLQQPGAVTLEECLDAFAKEEKIPEAYCSKCKDFRVQTKRMSLWRLPPVMIIHLKRFQFTQQTRRKLRDLVVFPIEGLDLSRIMASATDAAAAARKKGSAAQRPTITDEVCEENHGDQNSESLMDDGRSEMLYDLYGVVHHQGALSGGHYVASLKSELDGQFRLFNDAQIYEIHARDVVDPSAYILFYIRRDVAKAKLTDLWNVKQAGHGMSEEDMDQLLKGRNDKCVIS